mgnify:CR=1 FL=1
MRAIFGSQTILAKLSNIKTINDLLISINNNNINDLDQNLLIINNSSYQTYYYIITPTGVI